jgi:hypothetical protein
VQLLNLGKTNSFDPGDSIAETQLATDPIGQQETGKYFEHLQMRSCPFGQDSVAVNALYEACERY